MRPALQSVRAAIIEDARRRADQMLAAARLQADETRARARAEAESVIVEARAEGERDGDAAVAERMRFARHEATATVLGARREIYREACRLVEDAVLDLRRDPVYTELLHRLRALVVDRLGADADVEVDVPGSGGVVAHLGSRRVDCTLPALAHRFIDLHAGELEEVLR